MTRKTISVISFTKLINSVFFYQINWSDETPLLIVVFAIVSRFCTNVNFLKYLHNIKSVLILISIKKFQKILMIVFISYQINLPLIITNYFKTKLANNEFVFY